MDYVRVRPTRVERLRRRRARRRAVVASCTVAAGSLYLAVASAAAPVPSGGERYPIPAGVALQSRPKLHVSPGGISLVRNIGPGVWVVEASEDARLGVRDIRREATSSPRSKALKLAPARRVRVVVAGKAHDVLTNAATVRELLSAMRIEPGGRVTPPPKTPLTTVPRIRVEFEDPWARAPNGVEYGQSTWYVVPGFGAAHPWLPFGTEVTVTNLDTGQSITVVINDRGPFGGRIIDLSQAAFASIAPLGQGVMDVRLTW